MPEDIQPTPAEVPVQPEPPKEEKDELQIVEEVPNKEPAKPAPQNPVHAKFAEIKKWYLTHKKISIPATLLILIIIVLLVPVTRYKTVGLFYKKDFVISVHDSTANTPVSGASVKSGSVTTLTDGSGKATLKLPVGKHLFSISKKYYQDNTVTATVPILKEKNVPNIDLTATGRQVKITIKNTITLQPISSVNIIISDISAKTDNQGSATIVLPANLSTEKATLSLSGYNDAKVDVKISNTEVASNSYTLTPSGKVYFLSKRTGLISIMKSNLDGTSVETVANGTGSEELSSTQLLQSPDGNYVAYLAKRSSSDTTSQLYIIAASDDKLLSIDTGNTNFSIIGWLGDNLIYTAFKNDINGWQAGKDKLKSYAANSGKTTLLDQSSAAGDSTGYAYESFYSVSLLKSSVTYLKNWTGYAGQDSSLVDSKTSSLNTINPDGSNHKQLSTYPALDSVQIKQNAPNAISIWHQEYISGANHYYQYTVGGSVKAVDNISSDKFYDGSAGYELSPDMTRTIWSEPSDGKSTIIVGDSLGAGSVNVAEHSSYSALGWAGSDYVLVTKGNSELYIISALGGNALKITDFQPTTVF